MSETKQQTKPGGAHMENTAQSTPRVKRYSCKCKLCKAKWTTSEQRRDKAFDAHLENCERGKEVLAARIARFYRLTPGIEKEASERYQLGCAYFQYLPIEGRYNPSIKCDGRCMSATGHNCECSCGGANHGIGAAA